MRKRFVIHEHHASRLHFDLRLEIDGVLKSWAVPKGVSMNPADKRLAVAVPDHSLSYIDFEGTLAEGTYGAGRVAIWDEGAFEAESPARQLREGKLVFTFHGAKLKGEFTLVKFHGHEKNWLIIKSKDELADKNFKLETVLEPQK
ncbi:MAG TPA: DNA polymerase ligase N-terminal domain-containing protein [Pyrinomonadaceae bacterium]|jgi:bifunctional non-homologous end joining protein LigD